MRLEQAKADAHLDTDGTRLPKQYWMEVRVPTEAGEFYSYHWLRPRWWPDRGRGRGAVVAVVVAAGAGVYKHRA